MHCRDTPVQALKCSWGVGGNVSWVSCPRAPGARRQAPRAPDHQSQWQCAKETCPSNAGITNSRFWMWACVLLVLRYVVQLSIVWGMGRG